MARMLYLGISIFCLTKQLINSNNFVFHSCQAVWKVAARLIILFYWILNYFDWMRDELLFLFFCFFANERIPITLSQFLKLHAILERKLLKTTCNIRKKLFLLWSSLVTYKITLNLYLFVFLPGSSAWSTLFAVNEISFIWKEKFPSKKNC